MTIGIIGHGFVGKAVEHGFKEFSDILIYDKFQESDSFEDVARKSDIIFVCLPTPYKGERIDLSIMDASIEDLAPYTNTRDVVVVLKSTIVPGTTVRYQKAYPKTQFVFNPEFLTEKNYLDDFKKTDRIVIGGNGEALQKIVSLYRDTQWPDTPIYETDTTSAEMVKYMANTFLMTKVLFANEIYDLCSQLGVDYEPIKKMVAADKRIGESHLSVSAERGFGGKCFPKDIIALMGLYKDLAIDHALLDTVWKKNLRIREKRDWEDIPFVETKD